MKIFRVPKKQFQARRKHIKDMLIQMVKRLVKVVSQIILEIVGLALGEITRLMG